MEAGGPIRCYSDLQVDTNFQDVACDYIYTYAIDEFNESYETEVFPNPTSNFVSINSNNQIKEIKLFNFQGKLLKTSTKHEIDLSSFAEGLYLITINFESGIIV